MLVVLATLIETENPGHNFRRWELSQARGLDLVLSVVFSENELASYVV